MVSTWSILPLQADGLELGARHYGHLGVGAGAEVLQRHPQLRRAPALLVVGKVDDLDELAVDVKGAALANVAGIDHTRYSFVPGARLMMVGKRPG